MGKSIWRGTLTIGTIGTIDTNVSVSISAKQKNLITDYRLIKATKVIGRCSLTT